MRQPEFERKEGKQNELEKLKAKLLVIFCSSMSRTV